MNHPRPDRCPYGHPLVWDARRPDLAVCVDPPKGPPQVVWLWQDGTLSVLSAVGVYALLVRERKSADDRRAVQRVGAETLTVESHPPRPASGPAT